MAARKVGFRPVWQTLVTLLAFILFAAAFERLRVGKIVGFLLGGALIGPAGLGVIKDLAEVHLLAELGVVFLLFNLGLELKFERLRLFGGRVYLLACAQLLVTAAVIAMVAREAGLSPSAALIVGGGLALSSTAVVLQVLHDLGRTLTQMGRVAIAILLVQDIAVAPLLVAAKVLAGTEAAVGFELVVVVGKVLLAALVFVAARFLIRPALALVAAIGSDEVFTAAALAIVLGGSFATEQAGLSAALGAFAAGLLVADTEYRHQIAADVAPFRGLLLGFFFMTVGMTVDPKFALVNAGTVFGMALALLLLKAVLLTGLARALGYPLLLALELGAILAQGGEFGFVLFGFMASSGLLVGSDLQLLTIAIALSMAATPVIAMFARRLLNRLEGEAAASLTDLDAETERAHNHIVVVGFGQVGMALTRHLVGLKIPVLALDYDAKRVRASQGRGLPVFFGNANRADVLRAAHVGQARVVVVALPSAAGGEQVVTLVRQLYPQLRLLARVPDLDSVDQIRSAGASAVVVDGLTTARDLAERAVLLYEPEEESTDVASAPAT